MPTYRPNPTIITGGTGTGSISQVRRSKMGYRARRSRRSKRSKRVVMFNPAPLPKILGG